MQAPLSNLPAFGRRLSPDLRSPIAVAYSGGGDSLAVLVATTQWAERVGRRVLALHVDHGLQADSGAWAALAAEMAGSLGAEFQELRWSGEKPTRGVSAAARVARHGLIADAARAAGARVVVFGHTADDILEADLMRQAGSSLGRLAEWRPSPAWPQGRGLFLLRPLLGLRRAALREALAGLDLDWIEDPANADPRSLRARARGSLSGEAPMAPLSEAEPELTRLALAASIDTAGGLTLDRARLNAAAPAVARRFLSAALVCVGGGDQPPRRGRLDALLARLAGAAPVVATLAGAQLSAGREIFIARESGSYRRHGAPEIRLDPGQTAVWDGRFLIHAGGGEGARVLPLAGMSTKLDKIQKTNLLRLPPSARPGLPTVVDAAGRVTCPILAEDGAVTARPLITERLYGVCGVISQEPAA